MSEPKKSFASAILTRLLALVADLTHERPLIRVPEQMARIEECLIFLSEGQMLPHEAACCLEKVPSIFPILDRFGYPHHTRAARKFLDRIVLEQGAVL
jgi:hypothetical protein